MAHRFVRLAAGLLLFAPAVVAAAAFEKVALPTAQGAGITSLAIGPDGKLYGTVVTGQIRRWPINPDGTTGAVEIISSLTAAEGGIRMLIGLVFDPTSTPEMPIAWVTHSTFGFGGMADWAGKVTRLSGPNLETVEHMVTGLPRSTQDHVTNGITFGPDGALYFLQGSNSNTGAADPVWDNRPERLLSAAVLRLDPALIATPPLDVKTEEGGNYNPFSAGAPLTLFATGMRNSYDLVWHTNGQLYVTHNGSTNGGWAPAGTTGVPCAGGGTYPGPDVPGRTGIPHLPDYLYRTVSGGYYGHPNPLRCEFVLNGGNPTSGVDPAEVVQYPVGTQPDVNYRGIAHDFGLHRSPNGIIEYRNPDPGTGLTGKLLCVRFSQGGDDIVVLTPGGPNGDINHAQTGNTGFTNFLDPLDLIEDPATGNLYVSEYSQTAPANARVTLLRPMAVSVPGRERSGVSFSVAPNPATRPRVSWALPEAEDIEIAIFDLSGRRVVTLASGRSEAGARTLEWDGADASGQPAPAGLYFYRLALPSSTRIVRAVKLD